MQFPVTFPEQIFIARVRKTGRLPLGGCSESDVTRQFSRAFALLYKCIMH